MVGQKNFNNDEAKIWIGLRPVSPDGFLINISNNLYNIYTNNNCFFKKFFTKILDNPILGPLKKFSNIYINAGL